MVERRRCSAQATSDRLSTPDDAERVGQSASLSDPAGKAGVIFDPWPYRPASDSIRWEASTCILFKEGASPLTFSPHEQSMVMPERTHLRSASMVPIRGTKRQTRHRAPGAYRLPPYRPTAVTSSTLIIDNQIA
jgi:hypothetical protein